jgi:hypothetical protein
MYLSEQVFNVFFLSKTVTDLGIKRVVLSGERADKVLEVICILNTHLGKFQRN